MSQQTIVRNTIRSLFSTIVADDDTDLEAILLVLQHIRVNQETQYRELSQKLDHFLSLQSKPVMATKTKKPKKASSPAMSHFIATYFEQADAYKSKLGAEVVDALLSEYEDLFKDMEPKEQAEKQAELIWMHLAQKDEEFIKQLEGETKEDEDEAEKPKKSSKSRSSKVADDAEKPKKSSKSRSSKAADDAEKPKKSSKSRSSKATEAADDAEKPKKSSKSRSSKVTEATEDADEPKKPSKSRSKAPTVEESKSDIETDVDSEDDLVAEESDADSTVVEEVPAPKKKSAKKPVAKASEKRPKKVADA